MLNRLIDAQDVVVPAAFADASHPIRKVTRQVAFDGAWDSSRATKFGALFDGLARDWSQSHGEAPRQAVVADAVSRGGADTSGTWLDCGSGTGINTTLVGNSVENLVALDLSAQMLAHAPDVAPKVRGDSSNLPFRSECFDTLLLVNMLLFPAEVDRVLKPGGTLLWVNTLGDQTPIHLPADDVLSALPGQWSGVTANAGSGFWLAAQLAS